MSKLQGEKFKIFNPGGQGLLGFIIRVTKFFSPSKTELYPAWQGMQYMHNMIDEKSKTPKLDNDNYGEIQWTKVEDLLKVFLKK